MDDDEHTDEFRTHLVSTETVAVFLFLGATMLSTMIGERLRGAKARGRGYASPQARDKFPEFSVLAATASLELAPSSL